MSLITNEIMNTFNQPGKVGILATAGADGQPNAAYFGSAKLNADGTLVVGLGDNRSLKNLEQNPKAAYFLIEKSPVEFQTPGYRLYLKAGEIQKQGQVLDAIREAIAARAGEGAAKRIQAAAIFEVTSVRGLVDQA